MERILKRVINFQIRALSHIGWTQEAMGNFTEAIGTQENHLTLANKANHLTSRITSLASLGRLHFNLGQIDASVSYLEQALAATEGTDERQDEAIIRYRLGMALWQQNLELEEARSHLDKSAMILEMVRRETSTMPQIIDGRMTSNLKMTLFDIQTQCYQALQRVLVNLGRENEALVIAEKARTRAFVDLLMNKQKSLTSRLDDWTPSNESQLVQLVNRQKATVLYFSIADNFLYTWLVVPNRGVIKFHQVELTLTEEGNSTNLDEYLQNARESLGVDSSCQVSRKEMEMDENNSSQSRRHMSHLDALAEKLNSDNDKTGFFQMVNRSSRLNASSYSLSSLYSVGSINCGSTLSGFTTQTAQSRHESIRNRRSIWQGPAAIKALYSLLLEPMEDEFPEEGSEIMLVLDSNLFMVPWAMLKGPCIPEYFCERYSIIQAPSLTSTRFKPKGLNKTNETMEQKISSFVIGNPKLPSSVVDHWGWSDLPKAAKEAENVAEILQTPSSHVLTGEKATKSAVLSHLSQAECVHFACHISWQLSAIVLSPGEFVESKASDSSPNNHEMKAKRFSTIEEENEESSETNSSATDMPALSDFLLTAADILNCKLSAKLVVLSCGHANEDEDQANSIKSSEGLMALTKAILAAGAQCVMITLWPVPESSVNLVMKPLYSALLQGTRISHALTDAIITVQNTKHFAHPANWAGFALVGSDIRLSNRVALMSRALREILASASNCREVLRVSLHLVEKSLQRIHRGSKTAMYTSQQSIEKKVHANEANGQPNQAWKDLLMSVGFRFEPASSGIPPSVFFPQSDPGERLTQCSASLQAILGLNSSSWKAMAKLCESCPSTEASDEIIALFRQVVVHMNDDSNQTEVPVNVRLWRVPGCHELLASLGFDLMEVGGEDVTLKTGKSASRRQIQFALQSLLALFDPQEAPRSIELDEEETTSEEDEEKRLAIDETDINPSPSPRKHSFLLDSNRSSAFTSYRKRGEPDGRQSGNPDSPTATGSSSSSLVSTPLTSGPTFRSSTWKPGLSYQANMIHPKGHESDCNFTPSPVEPHPRSMLGERPSKMFNTLPSDQGSPLTSSVRQGMFNSKYSHNLDDSSSSAGSIYEMRDHHHHPTLALRQPGAIRRQSLLNTRSAQHLHPAVHQRITQAVSEIATDVGALRTMGSTVPLYENTDFTSKQPAGRPILPIRSVFTDVGYHSTLKLQDKSDPNDKFNVRTEIGKLDKRPVKIPEATNIKKSQSGREDRLHPGVTKRVPPTGESGSPESTLTAAINKLTVDTDSASETKSVLSEEPEQVKDFSSQIRRLNREVPISDVYHDRNIGLGMAPPLSKLILANNLQVVQVDHHSSDSESVSSNVQPLNMQNLMTANADLEESLNSIDNLSVIEDAHKRNSLASSARTVIIKDTSPPATAIMPPPIMKEVPKEIIKRPLPPTRQEPWYNAGLYGHFHARDEGDGRSMTDSQYSGCSPNGQLVPKKPSALQHRGAESLASQISYMKMGDFLNDQEITVLEEKEVSPTASRENFNPTYDQQGTRMRPKDIAQYINTQLKMPESVSIKRRPINILPSQASPLDPRTTRHPQQMWDKNSGFTYTGMFSSDC